MNKFPMVKLGQKKGDNDTNDIGQNVAVQFPMEFYFFGQLVYQLTKHQKVQSNVFH